MRKVFFFWTLVTVFFRLDAQIVFKAIVSRQTVVVGESFQVQFILETGKISNFAPPDFAGFRVVSGPDTYAGSMDDIHEKKEVKNLVYTLSALKPGLFKIPGATGAINGETIQSNKVSITVVSREDAAKGSEKDGTAANSEYFLRPGEDPYDKIRKNLFLKVLVDHQTCYVGEPILATFKLYSRLESRSDIVKNPGFYGFTVHDMVNLSDKQVATEKVKGKLFDVHTIRKVQLYPLQSGEFTIDEMEVKNKVEFSRSMVDKKTEQEIVEGVLNIPEYEPGGENTTVVETDSYTPSVQIHVKPLPLRNKPTSYNGATGRFAISSHIIREPLSTNSEGILEVAISGKGNFVQLDAPIIQWPAGLEGQEPQQKDSLDKTVSPLAGSRIFHYPFVATRSGKFTLPPLIFSYFNPDTGNYKIVSTAQLSLTIRDDEVAGPTVVPETVPNKKAKGLNTWLAVILAGLLVIGGLAMFIRRKRSNRQADPPVPIENPRSIDKLLAPVYDCAEEQGPRFYQAMQQAIWIFAGDHFNLSGSARNKDLLSARLHQKNVDGNLISRLLVILHLCDSGIFGNAGPIPDHHSLLVEIKRLMEEIETSLV